MAEKRGFLSFLFDGGVGKGDKKDVKPNRWFLWACIVLLLAGEGFLYNATQQKNVAQTKLRDAEEQNQLLHREMDQYRLASSIVQSNELARLHRENANLTLKLNAALETVKSLSGTNAMLAQDLDATRQLATQQQDALQQIQTDDQTNTVAATVPPAQAVPVPLAEAQRQECINNLHLIDAAKQQWAIDKDKGLTAIPTVLDLLPYLPDGFPSCPSGGKYTIHSVEVNPACSFAGHVLVAQ
jgi:hypothetical protein